MFGQIKSAADHRCTEVRDAIAARFSNFELPASLEDYAESIRDHSGFRSYGDLPVSTVQLGETLREASEDLAALYNQFLIAHLIATFDPQRCSCRLPVSITKLYDREFRRMLRQIDELEPAFFDLNKDPFVKDVAILTFRLIPIGAEFVQPKSGVPRRVLFQGGVGQFITGLAYMLFRAGGFKPYFELHVHTLSLDDFNAEGWNDSLHRLAELLRLNSDVKGWTSSSWFLDPKVAEISPHLAYMRTEPREYGAALFFVGRDPPHRSGALSRSRTRRRLYESGEYVPTIYMRVWPRQAMTRWCERNPMASPS